MDPNDFKSTIQNILELDIGEDWVDSEDESELGDYATEKLPAEIVNKAERKQSQTIRIVPDQRKSSTGSQTSTDSLDEAEVFTPVEIDVDSLKGVLHRYEKHRKISMSKLSLQN